MKRIIAVILIPLLLLPLVCCTAGTGPENTPAPDESGVPESTAGNTAAPAPTAPPDMSYDPDTDYNNLYATITGCDIVETEDAYYLHFCRSSGFLYYYDKTIGEGGVLCPRPECEHDERADNRSCSGYIGSDWPTLQYYEGKLWYIGPTGGSGMVIGVYRMDLDGSEKELVRSFDMREDDCPLNTGNRALYLHRGILYHAGVNQTIKNGDAYNELVFGCVPLSDMEIGGERVAAFEYHTLLTRKGTNYPQPLMYFVGDYAYMLYQYNGVEQLDRPTPPDDATEEEQLEWLEWYKNAYKTTDEIARWYPAMSEPEILYSSTDTNLLWQYRSGYVTHDGTVYASDTTLTDSDADWDAETNPFIVSVYRLEADGTLAEVFNTREYGDSVLLGYGEGLIATIDLLNYRPKDWIPTVRIFTFEGELIAEGQVPLAFRERFTEPDSYLTLVGCLVTEDKLLLCYEMYFDKGKVYRRWFFLEETVTPEGFGEKLLNEGAAEASWR